MNLVLIKILVSAAIIAAASEIAKRVPALAALIVSLPLVSVLVMVWMQVETKDAAKIATHAEATFWYVLPSMPMFLILPAMLRGGLNFWVALAACCGITALLYLLTIQIATRFGVSM
jgi:hypothetical protein